MQVRVDDDMRVILTLTAEEYGLLGGDKENVADFVEEEIEIALDSIRLDRAVSAGSDSAPSPEVEKAEPPVVEPVAVAPGGEFAIPVTTPEVMTE